MSKILREWLFLNYLLPDKRAAKKWTQIKQDYQLDMQLDLRNGKVTRCTNQLKNPQFLVSQYIQVKSSVELSSLNIRKPVGL